MEQFGLAFLFILVAVDPFGLLAIFISLTEGITAAQRLRIIIQSMATALFVAVSFMFVGSALLRAIGVTIPDFMIAGGVVLFIIAVVDLMGGEKKQRIPPRDLGVVPLGTPLIVGPAVLASVLLLPDVYGLAATILATLANILLVGILLLLSDLLVRVLGGAGTKALSKVFLLLLAAFAVMMVREGITRAIEAGT